MSYLHTVNTEFFVKIDAGILYTNKSAAFSFNSTDVATNVKTKILSTPIEVTPGLYHAPFIFTVVGNYIIEIINTELWQLPQLIYIRIIVNANAPAIAPPGSPIIFKYKSLIQ